MTSDSEFNHFVLDGMKIQIQERVQRPKLNIGS